MTEIFGFNSFIFTNRIQYGLDWVGVYFYLFDDVFGIQHIFYSFNCIRYIKSIKVEKNKKTTVNKKPKLKGIISKLHFEKYKEGKSEQIMHIGPYSEEGSNIQKIHDFIKQKKGSFDGHNLKHHEIYLSDPGRSKPESMRTVLRQPFI
ncbi:MAG: hypothetical protein EU552_01525 [Promethearchaeota archaeon]|nr:MAG: hypothetical protein EU552_01525 [Candidatus Lokiarchaeota archaeon]